jgi:hypothetical protein
MTSSETCSALSRRGAGKTLIHENILVISLAPLRPARTAGIAMRVVAVMHPHLEALRAQGFTGCGLHSAYL